MPEGVAKLSAVQTQTLGALLFVVVFFWAAVALGRRLTIWLRLGSPHLTRLERGLVALALGIGALQFLPFGLAAFHVMREGTVRLASLALCALLLPDMAHVARALRREVRAFVAGSVPKAAFLAFGLFATQMAILLVHALAMGTFGDDDGYHLSAPMRWLRDGTLSYLPTYTNTNAAMGFEMLYVIALSFVGGIAAKLLHLGAGLAALLALILCARRLGSAVAGAIAGAALMVSTPIVNLPFLFSLAYVDFAACLTAMTSVLVWLVWRETGRPAFLIALGLFAGLTGSFKFTALSVGIAWALTIAVDARWDGLAPRRILGHFVRFGTTAAIPVAPWLVRNWLLTGNPVCPMFSSLIPTRDWSAEHAATFSRYTRYYAWGVASGSHLGEAERLGLLAVTALLVMAAAGALVWFARERVLRLLVLFASVYTLICVAVTGLVFRYWLPGIMCFGLVACILLVRKLDERMAPRLAAVLAAVALLVQSTRELRNQEAFARDFRMAFGLSTPDCEYAEDPAWRMWSYIRSQTPRDARVLMGAFYTTFGASSFGCFPLDRVCFTTDSHLQAHLRLDDWKGFLAGVATDRIQYLVLSREQFSAGRHGFAFTAAANEYPFCARLAEEFGEKLFESGPLVLYKIRGGPNAASMNPANPANPAWGSHSTAAVSAVASL